MTQPSASNNTGLLSRSQLGFPSDLGSPLAPISGGFTGGVNGSGGPCWEHFNTNACADARNGVAGSSCVAYGACMRALHPGVDASGEEYWKRFTREGGGAPNQQACPAPPTGTTGRPAKSGRDKYNEVASILESMGADQECKSAFDNVIDNDFTKTDSVLAACATPLGNVGPELRVATTNSSQNIQNAMQEAGCKEVMMAVNKQVLSELSMTCEMNNNSATSSVEANSMAQVRIETTPTYNADALIAALGNPPRSPIDNVASYGGNIEMFRLAGQIYDRSLAHYTKMFNSINGRGEIRGTTIQVSANQRIKSLSSLNQQSTAKIQENMEATIRAQAESDIQREVGFGSTDSASVSQLVQNAIDSNRSAIATMVSNAVSNSTVQTSASGIITLIMPPNFSIRDTTISADTEIDIIADASMESARDFGRTISMSILAEAAASAGYSTTSGGVDEALKAIGEANLALSKANKPYNDGGSFGGIIVFVIIGAAIFFILPKLIPGGGSPVMIIGITVAVYFVVALIFGFWPFNSSSEDKRVHVPMNVPSLDQSFGKSYSNAEYSRKNNGNNSLSSPRFYDTPYNKRNVNSRERVYRQR